MSYPKGNVHFLVHELKVGNERADGGDLVEVKYAEGSRHITVLAYAGRVHGAGSGVHVDLGVIFDDVREQNSIGFAVRDVEMRAKLMRHTVVKTERCGIERHTRKV